MNMNKAKEITEYEKTCGIAGGDTASKNALDGNGGQGEIRRRVMPASTFDNLVIVFGADDQRKIKGFLLKVSRHIDANVGAQE